MLPNDQVFRFMNYHLRVIFKIFGLGALNPDQATMGEPPPPGSKSRIFRSLTSILFGQLDLSFFNDRKREDTSVAGKGK